MLLEDRLMWRNVNKHGQHYIELDSLTISSDCVMLDLDLLTYRVKGVE